MVSLPVESNDEDDGDVYVILKLILETSSRDDFELFYEEVS
jgi:hypothetical protein